MARVKPGSRRSGADSRGYTLVALVVIFSVMTILLAASMPYWSQIIQRDREEELIFRGLQYAEAIRVFQLRQGRYPISLEELVKTRPRSIRQPYKDPMTEGGGWGLIFAQSAGGGQPGQQPGGQGRVGAGGRTGGTVSPQNQGLLPGFQTGDPQNLAGGTGPGGRRRGEVVTVGPIIGVHSLSQETGAKVFFGSKQYGSWQFTVNILPVAIVDPATLTLPRVTSQTLGRPFPDDLNALAGSGPEDAKPLGLSPMDDRSRGSRSNAQGSGDRMRSRGTGGSKRKNRDDG